MSSSETLLKKVLKQVTPSFCCEGCEYCSEDQNDCAIYLAQEYFNEQGDEDDG